MTPRPKEGLFKSLVNNSKETLKENRFLLIIQHNKSQRRQKMSGSLKLICSFENLCWLCKFLLILCGSSPPKCPLAPKCFTKSYIQLLPAFAKPPFAQNDTTLNRSATLWNMKKCLHIIFGELTFSFWPISFFSVKHSRGISIRESSTFERKCQELLVLE